MNPAAPCLHICSCQHPGHSVCQHGPAYVQGPRSTVGANSSPGFRAAPGYLSAALRAGHQEEKLVPCQGRVLTG